MKRVLLMIALCVGMVACSNDNGVSETENSQKKKDVVEVMYFHGAQRCATCRAIENVTKELIDEGFWESLKDGKLLFRTIDFTKEKTFAERYDVAWSSLIVVDYDKGGNEHIMNMTDLAFEKARTSPEEFKKELSTQISTMLNN